MKRWKLHVLIAAFIVIADQLLKRLALAGSILFDSSLLSFSLVKNTGSTFGTLQGFSQYLVWISFIFLGILIYYYPSSEHDERLPIAVLCAGITGNLIDRVAHGYVVDFVNLHWWPVFNVADMVITIGILWFLLLELKKKS